MFDYFQQVTLINDNADVLIGNYRHPEAASVVEWLEHVNKAWGDLLKLIDKTSQFLAKSATELE